ncbi:hypothetical protein MMMDOFMJ_4618 [Methylobacterium gnaphalii]|nr:hypothetical protein MMMDOFMJ_4618 [Methylobacterium gnaphalii]
MPPPERSALGRSPRRGDRLHRFRAEAHALGWMAAQLFVVHPEHGTLRVGYCGALMISGRKTTAIEPRCIRFFEDLTFYRDVPGKLRGLPIWKLKGAPRSTKAVTMQAIALRFLTSRSTVSLMQSEFTVWRGGSRLTGCCRTRSMSSRPSTSISSLGAICCGALLFRNIEDRSCHITYPATLIASRFRTMPSSFFTLAETGTSFTRR